MTPALETQRTLLSFWASSKKELSRRERADLEGQAMVISFTSYEILLQPVEQGERTVVVVARNQEDLLQADVLPADEEA